MGQLQVVENTFGKYTLLGKLGQGGMAEVYLALSEGAGDFQKLLVIKRAHPHFLDEPDVLEMFLDEARLAARLAHPNVVQTHEVGDVDGLPFLAMEYLEGQTLRRVLRAAKQTERALPQTLALEIALRVLDGLHYAHELKDFDGTPLGVVHRDVSPSNIFITYTGLTKVLDFGIAKATISRHQTRTGQIKGKLTYMAPEQAHRSDVDRRADVWSAGVSLWNMLTPVEFHGDAADVAVLRKLMRGDVRRLQEVMPDVAPELASIVNRALEPELDKRYATALEMRRDIATLLGEASAEHRADDLSAYVCDLFSDAIERQGEQLRKALSNRQKGSVGMREVPTLEDEMGSSSALRLTSNSSASVASVSKRFGRPLMAAVLTALVGVGVWLGFGSTQPKDDRSEVAALAPASVKKPNDTGAPVAPQPLAATPQVKQPEQAEALVAPEPEPDSQAPPAAATGERKPAREAARRRRRRKAVTKRHAARSVKAAPGYLYIDTVPWSVVTLNGRRLGTTPLIRAAIAPGTHKLLLKNPESKASKQITVTVESGQVLRRRLVLR